MIEPPSDFDFSVHGERSESGIKFESGGWRPCEARNVAGLDDALPQHQNQPSKGRRGHQQSQNSRREEQQNVPEQDVAERRAIRPRFLDVKNLINGYMAPEYAMRGYLTYKADVYSYGIVILEIISGKSNTNYRPKDEFVYLLDWAYVLQEQGTLLDLVDPSLGSDYSKQDALRLLNLALLCTNPSPSLRPIMSAVVSMIEGTSPVQAQVVKLSELELTALKNMSCDTHSYTSTTSQTRSMSMDGPWIDSSITIPSKYDSERVSSSDRLIH